MFAQFLSNVLNGDFPRVNLDGHAIDVEFNDCIYVFACVDEL